MCGCAGDAICRQERLDGGDPSQGVCAPGAQHHVSSLRTREVQFCERAATPLCGDTLQAFKSSNAVKSQDLDACLSLRGAVQSASASPVSHRSLSSTAECKVGRFCRSSRHACACCAMCILDRAAVVVTPQVLLTKLDAVECHHRIKFHLLIRCTCCFLSTPDHSNTALETYGNDAPYCTIRSHRSTTTLTELIT